MYCIPRRLLLVLCVVAATQPLFAQKVRTPLEKLSAAVAEEVDGKLFRNSLAAVEITDVRSGKVLFSRNGNLLLRPASNTKLFTSAAALLGIDDSATFVTRLGRTGARTLVCTAGGDPLFSLQDIQKLAMIARISGMPRIDTLILDPAAFDTTSFGEGWMWDDESDPFLPALSPFCVESNIFTLHMKQPKHTVVNLDVSTTPLIWDLVWSYKASPGSVQVSRLPRSNEVRISGTIAAGSNQSVRLPMWQPQKIFADLLVRALLDQALVDSSLVIIHRRVDGPVTELASLTRPLDEVLAVMNKESDNLCAEMMLRLVGLRGPKHLASAKAGLETMEALFEARGLSTGGMSLVDGSGISFYNLATANSISRVLRMMAAHPRFDRYRASLAIAGVDGTLRGRMKEDKLGKYFQGKTGTLRGVSALSGYVQAPGGRLMTVVMLMQNFVGEAGPYRRVQDRIVRHCIEYSASPATATQPR